jgi:hypothetical protein
MRTLATFFFFFWFFMISCNNPETSSNTTSATVIKPTEQQDVDNKNETRNASVIGTPIKIGRLEISANDFPQKMNWSDADSSCKELGEGWRLPTIEELDIIYQNKSVIGGFENQFYWSSNIQTLSIGDITFAFKKSFSNGETTTRDAWISGEASYYINGRVVYASPEDTDIQPLKSDPSSLPKEIFERKGTYRDFNRVRAVRLN